VKERAFEGAWRASQTRRKGHWGKRGWICQATSPREHASPKQHELPRRLGHIARSSCVSSSGFSADTFDPDRGVVRLINHILLLRPQPSAEHSPQSAIPTPNSQSAMPSSPLQTSPPPKEPGPDPRISSICVSGRASRGSACLRGEGPGWAQCRESYRSPHCFLSASLWAVMASSHSLRS
jgi:hypothetical protein